MCSIEATVRRQESGMGLFGKVVSKKLSKYIGKKVLLKIREVEK